MKTTTSTDDEVPLPSPKTFTPLEKISSRLIDKVSGWRRRNGSALARTRRDRGRSIENPLIQAFLYLGKCPFSGYHVLLALTALVLALGTHFSKTSLYQAALVSTENITLEERASFATTIDPYTPSLQEDPAAIVLATALENTSGYYSQPLLATTVITETPKPAEESPAERTKPTQYIVQEGDTLSGIGWRFGLKVASIQYQNKITGEQIKPGQKLTLPASDISPKLIAKAKAEEEQKKKLLALNSSRKTTTRERSSDWSGNSSNEKFVKPMNYQYISRRIQYGHNGTDMIAPIGTPVRAARSGKVVDVSYGWSGGYGIMVLIDHGGGVKTRYAHLSSASVSAGEIVGAGEVIARSGNTGRSTGPHLHFEAIINGRYTAPF